MIVDDMTERARILIAEDDDLTLELLATVLRGAGHEVTPVADGKDALDELQRGRFDLVVADVQMPRASGLEILEALDRDSPETPLVLVTAYANPGAAMDAMKVTVNGDFHEFEFSGPWKYEDVRRKERSEECLDHPNAQMLTKIVFAFPTLSCKSRINTPHPALPLGFRGGT